MSWIQTAQEIFDAMTVVKSRGSAFCTNFYPSQEKFTGWIARQQLKATCCGDSVFFFRQDRDFWHLYFCAPNVDALRKDLRKLKESMEFKCERVVTDIIGNTETLDVLLPVLENAGLRQYKRLERMARTACNGTITPAPSHDGVVFADSHEAGAVLGLIEETFDRFSKQIPSLNEIDAALCARQILKLQYDETLAGLLYYETRGATSTVRYWVVAPACHNRRVGSALMHHYLRSQKAVRRFVLWVDSDNEDAITKYRHYHYARDEVVDYVLANERLTR